jgi:hypothetical protein
MRTLSRSAPPSRKLGQQTGRTFVVTGANSGIGLEVARRQVYRNTKQANLLFARELHRRSTNAGSRSARSPCTRKPARPTCSPASSNGPVVPWSPLRALDPSTPSGAFVGPARFGQFRGRPQLLDVYASAGNPATAAHLWKLTEHALGKPLPV